MCSKKRTQAQLCKVSKTRNFHRLIIDCSCTAYESQALSYYDKLNQTNSIQRTKQSKGYNKLSNRAYSRVALAERNTDSMYWGITLLLLGVSGAELRNVLAGNRGCFLLKGRLVSEVEHDLQQHKERSHQESLGKIVQKSGSSFLMCLVPVNLSSPTKHMNSQSYFPTFRIHSMHGVCEIESTKYKQGS